MSLVVELWSATGCGITLVGVKFFSTEHSSAPNGFDRWRLAATEMFHGLDVSATGSLAGFRAGARSRIAGPIKISRIRCDPMRANRASRHILADGVDECLVTLQIRGHTVGSQAGRSVVLRPGDFAMFDASQPYRVDFGGVGFDHVIAHVPRTAIASRGIDLHNATATPIPTDSPVGRPLFPLLLAIEQSIDLSVDAMGVLGDLWLSYLLTTIRNGLPSTPAGVLRQDSILDVKKFIGENLTDPTLSPATIANNHGMSVRQLHRLFAGDSTTVGVYVRSERLALCVRDLSDPNLNHLPIAAIGARWGIPDPTSLSRAFRQAYGRPPRAFRSHLAAQ